MSDKNARLIIPDIHHKVELVERIRGNHPGMPAIFLGDYFDDFDDTAADMEKTCQWLKGAVENHDDEFLLGNHCFAYLSCELGVRWGFCSGWTVGKQQVFHRYFPGDTLVKPSAWILNCQGWFISHAGITNKLYRSFSKRKTFEEIVEWVNNAESALMGGIQHPAFMAFSGVIGKRSNRSEAFASSSGILLPETFATSRAMCVWTLICTITVCSKAAS
ncbi:MAG TPA: hypothetical protein VF283_10300 [Bryobacteraceae bacterium]